MNKCYDLSKINNTPITVINQRLFTFLRTWLNDDDYTQYTKALIAQQTSRSKSTTIGEFNSMTDKCLISALHAFAKEQRRSCYCHSRMQDVKDESTGYMTRKIFPESILNAPIPPIR